MVLGTGHMLNCGKERRKGGREIGRKKTKGV